MKRFLRKRIIKNTLLSLIAAILLTVSLFPYLWTISNSLKPNEEIAEGTLIPHNFTLSSYRVFLAWTGIFESLRNSVIVASLTTFITICLAFFAAYGIARFKIPGRKTLFGIIMGTQFIPLSSLIVPFYFLVCKFRLLDTWWSLIIVYLVYCLPFAMWLLIGYIQQISKDLDEAAMVDGCSRIAAIFKIVIPIARPAIFTTAVLVFIKAWEEYLAAEMLTTSFRARTLPVVLVSLQGQIGFQRGVQMAGAILFDLPVLFAFLYLHRYFMRGMVEGALKD
jgi:ABC-type glycerol-3-phosphate transport system permease component